VVVRRPWPLPSPRAPWWTSPSSTAKRFHRAGAEPDSRPRLPDLRLAGRGACAWCRRRAIR
jgi:hypothetical protein